MVKFLGQLFKKVKGIFSNGSGGGAGAPAENSASTASIKEIEDHIDRIVALRLPLMGHLLNFSENTKYWQSVFKALAFAESAFKLNCRYVEPPSLGKDVVTGMQNTSEGLLQLSYQDSRYHLCDFNWEADKEKSSFDLSKSIFDIEKNIACGMAIMNKLVGKKRHYIFEAGNYWAVLKPKNKRHKVFLKKFNQYQGG